jgi:hypothetical protein
MDIRNKLYPYPVLAPFTDDYKQTSVFKVEVESTDEEDHLNLDFIITLINKEIEELIKDDFAHIVIHIECPQTAFRTTVETKTFNFLYSIQRDKIRGRVEICPYVVAKKNISKYKNLDFNSEYGELCFDIECGCVLAVGTQFVFDIWTENTDLADIPSVFRIVRSLDRNSSCMEVDAGGQLIEIKLPEHVFFSYKALNKDISKKPLLLTLIIVPALMSALETLVRLGDERIFSNDLAWYKAVDKKLMQIYSFQIESPDFLEQSMVTVAQKLIGVPLVKAFQVLATLSSGEDEL